MFGIGLRSPIEAALLPTEEICSTDVRDYWEEFILSLSAARVLAEVTIRRQQQRSKERYDMKSLQKVVKVGDWVLIRFPQGEYISFLVHGMVHTG